MRLVVVTPARLLLDTNVEEVYAPGSEGQFGVLPEHVDFLTPLVAGEVRYREGGVDHYLAVSGGVCEVLGDTVTILADAAEPAEEIDLAHVERSEHRATTGLAKTRPGTPEHDEHRAAISRAAARRAVAARSR